MLRKLKSLSFILLILLTALLCVGFFVDDYRIEVLLSGLHLYMAKLNSLVALEWGGAISGILGAVLLSLNIRISRWAFVAYAISNVCWISYAIQSEAYGLLTAQLFYTTTTCIGFIRWFGSMDKSYLTAS